MLFENLLNAAMLMEVIDALVEGRLSEDDYIFLLAGCPLEMPVG